MYSFINLLQHVGISSRRFVTNFKQCLCFKVKQLCLSFKSLNLKRFHIYKKPHIIVTTNKSCVTLFKQIILNDISGML